MVDGLAGRREIDGPVILAGDHRRVDEKVKRDGLERDASAGLLFGRECGAKLPAFGEDETGLISELRGRRACGIKDHRIPFEDHELIRGRHAFGLNGVVGGVEMSCSVGDVEMEGEGVERIALPWNRLSARLEFEAGEAGDGTVGPVVAGNPLGKVERERTGIDGKDQTRAKKLLLGLGGIDSERDRLARLRNDDGRCEHCEQSEKTRQAGTG